jgi:hypothetical protein
MGDPRTDDVLRKRMLLLLSDDEIACLSNAESAPRVEDGDEYLDLLDLDQGVRQAFGTDTPLGCVLPRKAICEVTWGKIVEMLPAPVSYRRTCVRPIQG